MSGTAAGGDARLRLGFGLDFPSLYSRDGLARLDQAYLDWLAAREPALAAGLRAARSVGPASRELESELLIRVAETLEAFVASLFGIEAEVGELVARHAKTDPKLRFKWKFVKRQAVLGTTTDEIDALDADLGASARAVLRDAGADPDDEDGFVRAVGQWQTQARDDPAAKASLRLARHYAAWAATRAEGRRRHGGGVIFSLPVPVEPDRLLEGVEASAHGASKQYRIQPVALVRRRGFGEPDMGCSLDGAMDEAKYCLQCHRQGTDSCSRGIRSARSPDGIRRSVLGVPLSGCPLDERISEFLSLKLAGSPIGALAMITLDNPMLAATGHRICNECSLACVFQEQTPVDIPAAETRVLRDVLELRWGFEIYALLTRWNPLSLKRFVPTPASGRNVLVVGAGPAGFTLAHHLLQAGHCVALIDGLRIEPLPKGSAPTIDSAGAARWRPIEWVDKLAEPPESRIAGGFGGVAEYGITSRWDKNFLTLIRLLLERRDGFSLSGGIRFGGSLDFDSAWSMGFDHVALALGAGAPQLPMLPDVLAPGVRLASDFLMGLQSGGAARDDSMANLQIRLPVVVIGGGLTAVDAACEALAYYPLQVARFARRHRALLASGGQPAACAGWTEAEQALARRFLAHADAIAAEQASAAREGRAARIVEMLSHWGGVTIAYRRDLRQSPAYRLNHEELQHALAQGVRIIDDFTPERITRDAAGDTSGLCGHDLAGAGIQLPAATVLIAVGTQPNTTLCDESSGYLSLDGDHFRPVSGADPEPRTASDRIARGHASMLLWCADDGRAITQFGDLHPTYAGSVVRAMASARDGAIVVDQWLARRRSASRDFVAIAEQLRSDLSARVVRVEPLAAQIVEIVLEAPAAARAFRPGQFYRLQNFERTAHRVGIGDEATRMGIEALALTGAWADPGSGQIGLIVLETGASSRLSARLVPGETVSLQGPTGAPSEIVPGESVMLVGGGLGNAVLFSIGKAMREAGNRVIYFAAYREAGLVFRREAIEAAADTVVWCSEQSPAIVPMRASDRTFIGNIIEGVDAALRGDLGLLEPAPQDCDRLLTIGSDRMMAAVAHRCSHQWSTHLRAGIRALASINSPMQCMMKAICAQCVQEHHDPISGERSHVFSCRAQDQALAHVDFSVLAARLGQNSLLEKQSQAWLTLCDRQSGEAGPPQRS